MKDITIKDLTGGEIAGSGNFDELMRTMKSNLEEEFRLGRITSGDYASAYVTLMQSVMQNAVHFTLSMNKANMDAQIGMMQKELLAKDLLLKIEATRVTLNPGETVAPLHIPQAMAHAQLDKMTADAKLSQEQLMLAQEATRNVVDTAKNPNETVAPLYVDNALKEAALIKAANEADIAAKQLILASEASRSSPTTAELAENPKAKAPLYSANALTQEQLLQSKAQTIVVETGVVPARGGAI